MVTSTLLYLLDAECKWKGAQQLSDITRLIVVDENPYVFVLVFKNFKKLVVRT